MYTFELDTLTWYRPPVSGQAPSCGNRHATVLLEAAEERGRRGAKRAAAVVARGGAAVVVVVE